MKILYNKEVIRYIFIYFHVEYYSFIALEFVLNFTGSMLPYHRHFTLISITFYIIIIV